MTWKILSTTGLLAALILGASGVQAQSSSDRETYHYSMELDIKKVVSSQVDANPVCGVVTHHLTYLDSNNQEHRITYLGVASNCPGDN